MDRCSNPSLVKILISTAEYKRLVHIEKKYLDLEKGSTAIVNSKTLPKTEDNVQLDQIGGGLLTDLVKKLPELTFDFLLDKGIYALESASSNSSSTSGTGTVKEQFTKFLSKALIDRFGIPPLFEQGNTMFRVKVSKLAFNS